MNRLISMSTLRLCERSYQFLVGCQRCNASDTLNRKLLLEFSSTIGDHRSGSIAVGSLKFFQSDSRTRNSLQSEENEASISVKEFSEIPGMKPWPIVGNLVQMMRRKDFDTSRYHIMWKNLIEEHGPIIKLSIPGVPTFVCSVNPDDLETIYKSTANNPMREAFEALKAVRVSAPNNYFNKKGGLLPELFSDVTDDLEEEHARGVLNTSTFKGLDGSDMSYLFNLAQNGDEWWRLRSRVQGPLLKPRNVAAYLPKVDKATLAYMDRIDLLQEKTGQVSDDFLEDLYKWALECVGVVALNQELGCLEPDLKDDSVQMRLIRTINEMFSAMKDTEMGSPFWKLYRTSAYVQLETSHNSFLEIADKALHDATLRLEEARAKNDPDRTLTVLEMFLNTEGLSKSDVATMILDMIFAGVDTTSHTLAFTLFLLATNPAAQKKLQEEVDSVLGDASELRPDHINEMVCLQNTVKESLRLYPLTVGNARVLTEEIVMSGYKVPAGSLAVGFNWMICRDKKYFPQPNDFLPERWARDRPYGPIHPYASLPFSTGKRMCIGKRIAEQEIYTFLIRAMQKFSVTFESTQEMDVTTQLVLKPAIPLPFKFHARK